LTQAKDAEAACDTAARGGGGARGLAQGRASGGLRRRRRGHVDFDRADMEA
jgi:hypothetical protein